LSVSDYVDVMQMGVYARTDLQQAVLMRRECWLYRTRIDRKGRRAEQAI